MASLLAFCVLHEKNPEYLEEATDLAGVATTMLRIQLGPRA